MLKQWFKSSTNKASSSTAGIPKYKTEVFVVKQDVLAEISQPNIVVSRLKALKELSEISEKKRLEENATEVLWNCTEDLIRPPAPTEQRHQVYEFFSRLIVGQRERISTPVRLRFFALVKNSKEIEDLHWMLEILKALTENGKDLCDFEDQFPNFVLTILPLVEKAKIANEFLPFLLNVVKTSSAYLGDRFTISLTKALCRLCCTTKLVSEVVNILEVVDAIVRYSLLRTESLQAVVPILCRLVNIDRHCPNAWRIMKNIIGTSIGTTAIYIMIWYCEHVHGDPALLRGAIFFLSVSLWGGNGMQVPKLQLSPLIVLPALKKALNPMHPIVTFESLLAVQRLLEVQNSEILRLVWNSVFQVLDAVGKLGNNNNHVMALYHSVLNTIEVLMANGQFNGDVDLFFSVVQQCSAGRPESSVMKLIEYRRTFLNPIYPNWIEQVEQFVKTFYLEDKRAAIQTQAVEVLASVIDINRKTYGDELIEDVFLPHFHLVTSQPDVQVRKAVCHLIGETCFEAHCKHFESLMAILRKVMNRLFEDPLVVQGLEFPDSEFVDVYEAVDNLVRIFKRKIYEVPSQHARLAYRLLLEHIQQHLRLPIFCNGATNARYLIFETFLQLRADSLYRIGLVQLQKFSPYLLVDHKFGEDVNVGASPLVRDQAQRASPVTTYPSNVTYVSLTDTCFAVIKGLMNEREWKILDLLLREIPNILSNKSLILSKNTNNIGEVCSKICQLVPASTNITPSTIRNAPSDFSRNKFLSFVFPILTCFTSYHDQLDPNVQQKLMKTLEKGVGNISCSRVCISALALCALEMQDTMHKLINSILFTVSKVSATVVTAEPMLMFLSILVRLPKVYSNFQNDQYMSVFAIAVQFTNPFKFNHYIVSLAYYVIGIWFLRLKPNCVKNCIKYITAGFKLNIDTLLEQQGQRSSDLNEDSANRRRSSSLSDKAVRRRLDGLRRDEIDDSVMVYHMELMETCMDLLGRYAFATYSAKPKRSGVTERIFKDGESQSWLIGNAVITVSTSPCIRVASRSDLCEKCWQLCRFEAEETDRSVPSTTADAGADHTSSPSRSVDGRRRHKTEQTRKPAHDAYPDREEKRMSRDDLYTPKSSRGDHDFHKISFGAGEDAGERECDKPAKKCMCWCQGWAEIHVRKPTGDTAWVMRIENDSLNVDQDRLTGDITGIFLPEICLKPVPTDSVFEEDLTPPSSQYLNLGIRSAAESDNELIASRRLDRSASDPDDRKYAEKDRDRIGIPEGEETKVRRQSSTRDRKAYDVIPEEQLGTSAGKDPSPLDSLTGPFSQLSRGEEDPSLVRSSSGSAIDQPAEPVALSRTFDSDFEAIGIRGRTQTLPTSMLGVRRPAAMFDKRGSDSREQKEALKAGSNTNFIFLQLYYFKLMRGDDNSEPPLHISKERSDIELSIRNLDKISRYETHKIGVIYVGQGQAKDETEILSNKYGSARYQEFLRALGTLMRLRNADGASTYLGGLDTNGNDGEFAYIWHDDIVQVIYHVATLMPNKVNDPRCNEKKRHIGNDFVTIVYNNSGDDYDISTIRCQFTHACVVVEPLEMSTNYVWIKARPEVTDLQYYAQEKTLISDANLALFVRQLAVHANIASKVVSSRNSPTAQALSDPYGSNWLHRLRQIKKIRSKLQSTPEPSEEKERVACGKPTKKFKVKDFTDFV